MELPWATRRCILCLRDDVDMSRSHLVPRSLGGFVWAWTHCTTCNNLLGTAIEGAIKRDDSVRHALEHELAGVIPEIARGFAQGQSYLAQTDTGNLKASFRGGDFELGTTKLDNSLVQDQERARKSVTTMLERPGKSASEIEEALARYAAAAPGELTEIADGIAIRHGTIETFVLPYDGEFVSDHFPLAIAFHLLAFFLGDLIYHESLNPIRSAVLDQRDDPEQFMVERLMDRSTGYVPMHVLGLSKPYLLLRIQIFGPLLWHVHLLHVRADKLKPMGMALDVKERAVMPAAPRRTARGCRTSRSSWSRSRPGTSRRSPRVRTRSRAS